MDRYMIGASYRYDGSSIFTEDFRWGNFLALSAGWVVSDEPFLVNNEVINFLKFRGSFGQTGNSAINPQATATTYAQWGRYGDTGAGDLLSTIANTAVTWETTDAYDVGADFELFEGRISGTVSYYVQDVRDMLFQVPIPQSSGIFNSNPTIWDNVGDMQNRGWEVELNTVNIDRGNFQWRMGINFATNENQVTRLAGEDAEIVNVNNNGLVTREGDQVGFFRLARYAGIHPEGGYELIEEMDLELFAETGERVATGNLIPATRANLSTHLFDNTDRGSLPTFFGGFNNSFTYKNFSLSALISFSGGNYIYDVARENSVYVNSAKPYREEIVGNYWQNPGDDAEFPALSWNQRYDVINEDGTIEENVRFDPQRSGHAHDKYLQKGDFIRMRALSFFYNLPRGVADSLRMQNIRLGFTVNNLFTITGYEGYDPEVVNLGDGLGGSSNWKHPRRFAWYNANRERTTGLEDNGGRFIVCSDAFLEAAGWQNPDGTESADAANDLRYQQLFIRVPAGEDPRGQFSTTRDYVWNDKYYRAGDRETNLPVLRLADIVLLRAFLRADSGDNGGARADLNMVRNRAGTECVLQFRTNVFHPRLFWVDLTVSAYEPYS